MYPAVSKPTRQRHPYAGCSAVLHAKQRVCQIPKADDLGHTSELPKSAHTFAEAARPAEAISLQPTAGQKHAHALLVLGPSD